MTKLLTREQRAEAAAAPPLTVTEKRAIFILALNKLPSTMYPLQGMDKIEAVELERRDNVLIAGTFLEDAAKEYAKATGQAAPTTYGDVRRELGLSHDGAHDAFCNCHEVDSKESARRLRNIDAGRSWGDDGLPG